MTYIAENEEQGEAMQYRRLGRTELQVSAIDVRRAKALDHIFELVTTALQQGVNLFDAAPMYEEYCSASKQCLYRREW